MYRMTKANMENEINLVKRSSERLPRRPPLLQHEPTTRNSRHEKPLHLLPTPPTLNRYLSSPTNNQPFSISTNINQDQTVVCLRLRNIPYSTTEKQIYDYFTDIPVQIEGCKILLDHLNRGAGEALVHFHNPQSCQIAYERKNRQIFYGRTLDLRRISLHEYQSAPLTSMLTVNDLTSSTVLNQRMPQMNAKRYSSYYERGDDRRNEKRPRWDGGYNNNKGNFNIKR